jgi:uncharacterized membrane protein YraQ (UPF0718 family)/copper chaperone CopZ
MELVIEILIASWAVLAAMAPYLLLGFFVAGVLSILISAEWVERHLGGRGLGQVFKASLFGVPLPLCSCGVLPVAASLRRQGASRGATTAFLVSTPQTGVDSIAVTYALLGPFVAVVRPLAALLTGFVGGALVHVADGRDGDEANRAANTGTGQSSCSMDGCRDDEPAHRHSFPDALRYGFVTLPRDIGKALLVGVALSGVISALIAPDTLRAYLGGGIVPMLVAMAIGIPLYVCATASTPIAASLIVAGLSPGAALVFLITGPATNSAALVTVWKVLGRRATILYLATIAVGALVTGIVVDSLISSGVVPLHALVDAAAASAVGHEHHHGGGPGWWFGRIAAVVLLLVVAYALWWPRRRERAEAATAAGSGLDVATLEVRGMHCSSCVASVTKALSGVAGVSDVDVQLDAGTATVRGRSFSTDQAMAAIRSLGFEVGTAGTMGSR